PAAAPPVDNNPLIPVVVHVEAAGPAVARRGARQRVKLRVVLVGAEGAGNFDGGLPGALDFTGDERLRNPEAVGIPPAGAAVSRRTARYRLNLRVTALVEGGSAGNCPGSPPCAVQGSGPRSNSRAGSRHRSATPGDRCQADCTGYCKNHGDGTSSVKHHEGLPCHALIRKPGTPSLAHLHGKYAAIASDPGSGIWHGLPLPPGWALAGRQFSCGRCAVVPNQRGTSRPSWAGPARQRRLANQAHAGNTNPRRPAQA